MNLEPKFQVRKNNADTLEYSFEAHPLMVHRIIAIIIAAIIFMTLLNIRREPQDLFLLTPAFFCFPILLLLFHRDYAIIVSRANNTVIQTTHYWPKILHTNKQLNFSDVVSIGFNPKIGRKVKVYEVFLQDVKGNQIIVGKNIHDEDTAKYLRAILISYIFNDPSALSAQVIQQMPMTQHDPIGRRMYGIGCMTLGAGMLSVILMFFWPPLLAFIFSVVITGVASVLCIRAIEAIEHKLVEEKKDPSFFFRIILRKRLAFWMLILTFCGEFVIAASIQTSINAGPETIAALFNDTLDNIFEYIGLFGLIVFLNGIFGFGFATADVIDANLKRTSAIQVTGLT